jgi:hypothetical protein
MDYRDFVRKHRDSGADITIAALPCDEKRASAFGLMKIDSTGKVTCTHTHTSPHRGLSFPKSHEHTHTAHTDRVLDWPRSMHTQMHTHMHVGELPQEHTHTCTHTHKHRWLSLHRSMLTHTRPHTCSHALKHMHTHAHAHTHMHTHR